MFAYPKGREFYIINDWNTDGTHVGQAVYCYSFIVGTLGFIKKAFEQDVAAVVEAYGTASQEYLSAMIIKRDGKLNFGPSIGVDPSNTTVYRIPFTPPLRTKKPNPKTTLLAFHGNPGIDDALIGRWSSPSAKKAPRGWKKIYKACKPTHWIRDYLKD